MANEKPSYYAIIPALVRYDNKICPNAKLLYGEITALCNKNGYCWATNDYFAQLYGVSKKSISTWIKQLKNGNHIKCKIVYKLGTKQIDYRYLQLVQEGMEEKVNTPMEEKVKENNTSINNTYNNTKKFKKPSIDEIKEYCKERNNNISPTTFFDFYESKGWMVGKNKMKDWRACVRTWENNNKNKQPKSQYETL